MHGVLVLVGSGEFTYAMEETDRFLLDSTSAKNVAIVPTAAGRESGWRKWVEDGIRHFKKIGAEPFGINVLNNKDAQNPKNVSELEKADFIYFSGGHPGHIFESLLNTPFWEKVRKKFKEGTILAGSSAGAMVMGDYVFANAQEAERETPVWKKAFGLIDYSIIPHFGFVVKHLPTLYEKVENMTPPQIKKNLMGIDENTALVIDYNNEARVTGAGKVYTLGDKRKEYKNGSKFELKVNI